MKKIIYRNKYIAGFAIVVGLSKLISQVIIGSRQQKENTKQVEKSIDTQYNGDN